MEEKCPCDVDGEHNFVQFEPDYSGLEEIRKILDMNTDVDIYDAGSEAIKSLTQKAIFCTKCGKNHTL